MIDMRKGTWILVVDDEKLIRLTMSATLKRVGYTPVAVGDVDSAVTLLKEKQGAFSAIISDIMMGDMDGFVFRDIVRGIDQSIPIFFLTALDPEEGGGFLKRILADPVSYYMPKSVPTEVLVRRIRQVVASRRVENFIERKMNEDRKSLELAAHIQHSMLPVRSIITPRGFYMTWWRPKDIVSGDLYEAVQFGAGCYLYVLGDVQGHGTSAALAMTAVQSFIKNLTRSEGAPYMSPAEIANLLQGFYRANLAEVSYMTAIIAIHRPLVGDVMWLSCGAPDIIVIDGGVVQDANPEHRGNLPIGLLQDTVYSENDVVRTPLSKSAVCIAYTDGLMDLSRDDDGAEKLPMDVATRFMTELEAEDRVKGSMSAFLPKFIRACEEYGYTKSQDDMTLLCFGARIFIDGVYEASILLRPDDIDAGSQHMGAWCREHGWPEEGIGMVQVVLEEKLMNVYDHGYDDRERLHAVVNLRLMRRGDYAELTVWDSGTPEPSIQVVTGDSSTVFDMQNKNMSNHGRGRLMVRELCDGIERNRYGTFNETIYHVKQNMSAGADEKGDAQ